APHWLQRSKLLSYQKQHMGISDTSVSHTHQKQHTCISGASFFTRSRSTTLASEEQASLIPEAAHGHHDTSVSHTHQKQHTCISGASFFTRSRSTTLASVMQASLIPE
ncbi:hypothetical protein NDU88_005926, partial [Pleurodeles waltl]